MRHRKSPRRKRQAVQTRTRRLATGTSYGRHQSALHTASQAVLQSHTRCTESRGGRVGAVAYRCSVSHSSCWSCSEVLARGRQRAEAQRHRNRMEHEVTLKAFAAHGASNRRPCQQPVKLQVNTRKDGGTDFIISQRWPGFALIVLPGNVQ